MAGEIAVERTVSQACEKEVDCDNVEWVNLHDDRTVVDVETELGAAQDKEETETGEENEHDGFVDIIESLSGTENVWKVDNFGNDSCEA